MTSDILPDGHLTCKGLDDQRQFPPVWILGRSLPGADARVEALGIGAHPGCHSKVRLETPCVRGALPEAGRGRPVSKDLETPRPRGARPVKI